MKSPMKITAMKPTMESTTMETASAVESAISAMESTASTKPTVLRERCC